jgi:hypothetical protein
MANKSFPFIATVLCALGWAEQVGAVALQIDEPWNTSGANTGTVGGSALTATSDGDKWLATLSNNDVGLYARVDLFGAGAQPAGTIGDFFGLGFGPGETDSFTITLQGALVDPVFFIGDIDVIGASITAPAGGVNLTSNADGEWNGLTLNTLSGAPQGTAGAFGTVQYTGLFAANSTFTFLVDFTPQTFSFDTIGIGVAAVPLPTVAFMFPAGLIVGLGWMRRRSH